MQASTSARGDPNRTAADTWPWECLDCGTTIYHDGEFCIDCAAAYRASERARQRREDDGLVDWMRGEPFPDYVLKVTAIAGVEVALTTVWLQMVLGRTATLDFVVPILG